MHANDVCTVPANIAGIPGLSMPCGFLVLEGLPVGLQLPKNQRNLGPTPHGPLLTTLGEPALLRTRATAAYAYEQATNWHDRQPSL